MNTSVLNRLNTDRPVVVTGVGAISAAGDSVSALWNAAVTARVTTVQQDHYVGRRSEKFAVCCAPAFDTASPEFRPVRRMDRCAQFAWWAAREAWHMAGLGATPGGERAGVMLGTSRGPLGKIRESMERVHELRYPASLSANCTLAALSGVIAREWELCGPVATIAATCASGAYAIAMAAEQILLGKAEVMLAGGAEAPLNSATLAQLRSAGVLGHHEDVTLTCRPFDRTRNGICLGEGSALLVLESAEHAQRRGAMVLAQLSGWATGVDRAGRTGVGESGTQLVKVAEEAMGVAGVHPGDLDAVNTHGTGTRLNDLAEANALNTLLGDRTPLVPCTSTKPVTGHCLGATAALEAVLSVESLRHQLFPPTANSGDPDPACCIRLQREVACKMSLKHVLSTSLGFWGYHAALLFSRWPR